MSNIDNSLFDGEVIRYRTILSWVIFVPYILVGIVLCSGAAFVGYNLKFSIWIILMIICLIMIFCMGIPCLVQQTSDFVVTNKRVIMQTGILSRSIFEMRIEKIESVDLYQNLAGKFLNYGNVTIRGTGDTAKQFADIEEPLRFRQAVLEQQR